MMKKSIMIVYNKTKLSFAKTSVTSTINVKQFGKFKKKSRKNHRGFLLKNLSVPNESGMQSCFLSFLINLFYCEPKLYLTTHKRSKDTVILGIPEQIYHPPKDLFFFYHIFKN